MSKDERNGRKDGFIKLSRRLTDWEWADDPSMLAVWVHCLLAANWRDYRYHGETIPRGCFLTSCRAFGERVGLSESTIRRCFDRLESGGEIDRQVTHRGTLVKVRNYAVFQDSETAERRTHDRTDDRTHDRTHDRTDDRQEKKRRNKEIKKNIEIENIQSVIRTNSETGTDAQPALSEIISFVSSECLTIDPERFFSYYTRKGWQGVTDWKARAKAWDKRERKRQPETLPEYYNAEPIRDPNPKPATAEEIETVRKQIQKGKQ